MLKEQGGKCAECGEPKTLEQAQGHHSNTRHADGGRTDETNGKAVCEDCHPKLHSRSE